MTIKPFNRLTHTLKTIKTPKHPPNVTWVGLFQGSIVISLFTLIHIYLTFCSRELLLLLRLLPSEQLHDHLSDTELF